MGVKRFSVLLPLLIFFSLRILNAIAENDQKASCDSCHSTKDGYVNVHILAHSHDDVGWTDTVDGYYTKLVQNILSTSFVALERKSHRRFMYVESAFLFKWWQDQRKSTQEGFKRLINNGQLELVNGGWSMNDEATTNYQSIIDQFTLGLNKINETFGACGRPKVGWQIDSFGHSSEMASIYSQMGFDGLFLGRIDYQDQKNRFENKLSEMIWQGSKSLGKKSELFTSILYNIYFAPPGFCYDVYCRENKEWKELSKYLDEVVKVYKTNNVILTMGGDFHYSHAESWFGRLDELISYANEQQKRGSKYHLIYSTPSCYLKAVHEETAKAKIKWPIMTDDFFPYATNDFSYWTGFYTSRPALKRFERMGNNFLQVCKQLSVLGNVDKSYLERIEPLKEAMGVLQHHDAISGTEQQHVASDYAKSLSIGIDSCEAVAAKGLNNLLKKKPFHGNEKFVPFASCLLTNISQCMFTQQSKKFVITIYNPLSRHIDHHVSVPVAGANYFIKGPKGEIPPQQMVPIFKPLLNIPGRDSGSTYELIFTATRVPPLGFKSYYIIKNPKQISELINHKQTFNKKVPTVKLGNDGFLSDITVNGKTIPIRQEFLYYQGRPQHNNSSGAYIFRPDRAGARKITPKATTRIYTGDVATEIHQIFNEWISQIIRVYHTEKYVELQWLVGPFPGNDNPSTEVISRFTTNLKSKSTFYTDSNGRQMLKRVRNARPTWELNLTQPISSNYYPVTSKILIRDPQADVEVAVLTDRSQGGTSLKDGEIELMVHRTTLYDDDCGVKEPLDEEAFGESLVVRGSHYLVVGPYSNNGKEESTASIEKDVAQKKLLDAWTFISPVYDCYDSYQSLYHLEYSGLNYDLPNNVHILTLEARNEHSVLLRLEHVFEKDEDPILSKPVDVDIEKLFRTFKVSDLRETTLGGNQWLDENNRMKFGLKEDGDMPENISNHVDNKENKFVITLNPMQIRTFVLEIQSHYYHY